MNESSRQRFDLADFVVGYLEQHESIVTPPAFGVYEALLPDELAADLHLEAYQRLAFGASQDEEVLQLNYNHPVVEEIAERLQRQTASAIVYVNNVRLNKQGLLDIAQKELIFPNARLSAKPKAVQSRAVHHYLRFNFKVSLISDEKQERLISTVVDLQGGYPVRNPEVLERLQFYETEPAFDRLSPAPLQWIETDDPLSQETLSALMPRVKAAVMEELSKAVAALQARTERHLELDRARIEGYYDDLERDLKQRLARFGAAEIDRRSDAAEKLDALHSERQMKLTHLAARYQVRVELELINLLVLIQPKIRLPVTISNRTASVTRTAVWDPLVHRLEPLVCDVCGQPSQDLHLCTGGHLAHNECLAPQCIDCSRAYCQRCGDQIGTCAVCREPVCRRSAITCPTCGRRTCRQHQNLCHAADGEPVDLAAVASEPEPEPAPSPEAAAPTQTRTDRPRSSARPAKSRKVKQQASSGPKLVKATRIYVEVLEDEPVIIAHVMRSTNRTWTDRIIQLTPQGIHVRCDCEKGADCTVNGYYHRPAPAHYIKEQLTDMLKRLRSEYLTPAKKTTYQYGNRLGFLRESPDFELPAIWQDAERLKEANRGFDDL